jgi:hypothetical protein
MDRLTERTADGIIVKEGYGEDALRTLYRCFGTEPMPNCANCDEGYCAVAKLAVYEDLEDQGRLLKLPCAVLDEFYCIWRNKGRNPIQKMQVKKIEIHERKGIVIQMEFVGNRGCLFRFYEDDFGKTVFLNREEAEAALKELKEGQ